MSPEAPARDRPKGKPRRHLGGVVAGLVAALIIVVGGGVLLYFFLRPRPADAVEEFIAGVQARDLERVKAACTANSLAFMEQFADTTLQQALDALPADSDMPYEIGDTAFDEAGARVRVRFPGAERGPDEIEFRVAREDGAWKVDVVATMLPLAGQLVPLGEEELGSPALDSFEEGAAPDAEDTGEPGPSDSGD